VYRAAFLGGGELIVTLRLAVAVAAGVSLSDTCTVKLDVPTSVGVPEITPPAASNVRPFGKLPCAIVQE
jgi:hypothetical protein